MISSFGSVWCIVATVGVVRFLLESVWMFEGDWDRFTIAIKLDVRRLGIIEETIMDECKVWFFNTFLAVIIGIDGWMDS